MAFIDSTVVNVALSSLQSNLHATVVVWQWVVESYGLFLGALILVGALWRLVWPAVDVLGWCGVLRLLDRLRFCLEYSAVVIARGVQGLGAAFLMPGSLSIISASFDEKTAERRSYVVRLHRDHSRGRPVLAVAD